jgi:hypothetical protein
VAAPSQKAALAAWGADGDLFASKLAERVDDPELMREPLAHPGKIIRRSRGTNAEQIAALPAAPPKRSHTSAAKSETTKSAAKPKPAPPSPPRPDRAALDTAERVLADLETRQRSEQDALARRQAELDRKRRALEADHRSESDKATLAANKARAAYDAAMRKWRGR